MVRVSKPIIIQADKVINPTGKAINKPRKTSCKVSCIIDLSIFIKAALGYKKTPQTAPGGQLH